MMELPQSRPFGGEGRKPAHDFLSICSHPIVQQDPRPPSQGNFLKTLDFLGKTSARESDGMSSAGKHPPPSVEHLLPGGIGTYTISHMSHFNERASKPETSAFSVAQTSGTTDRNDDNSNSSSYTNSGFTLWEESAAKKGKTGKENLQTTAVKESTVKMGQWASSERRSLSSSNNHHHSSCSSLSTLQPFGQKNQSFMDMIKSAKAASSQEDELDDEEEFVIKKEISPAPGDLRVKVDGKISDQKANTPRSKHSATEQRRRSKINDRFQMLRTLLPQNDQKRDKASFLLEVIEYIQFLQEKVQKYEGSYPGWNCEPAAEMMTWRSGQRHAEAYTDHSRSANGGGATLVFATKVEENTMSFGGSTSTTNHIKSDTNSGPMFKSVNHLNPIMTSKGAPFPVSLQPNIQVPVRTSVVTQSSAVVSPHLETKPLQPQSHTAPAKPWTGECTAMNDKLKEQELAIKGGTISISSAYSRGLFDTLTQALHSSGIDLSQATISVQIELGKRARPSTHKDSDSDQASKKLKTGKS